jgi:acyl-CoA reductase-like NAD-dependent aldehyde dehydrogenase
MAQHDILVLKNFIRGSFVPNLAVDPQYIESYEPATGNVWAHIPDSGEDDVHMAVQAAKNEFPRSVASLD